MRHAALVLVFLGLGGVDSHAQPRVGDDAAFVELTAPRATYFVQEPIAVTVRFGFEVPFLEHNLIPLFRQPLDLPVQLQAPWLKELSETVRLADPDPEEEPVRMSLALNDGVEEAVRVEDLSRAGRSFLVLEVRRRYLPTAAGELVFSAPRLRFAYATSFREDLLDGRVPEDRHLGSASGAELVLRVLPLPGEDRPEEFAGAVGRFEVEAEVSARQLEPGQSFRLVLRIRGAGNLASFDPPRLDDLDGFHRYGMIDEKGPDLRTLTYDLAPLSDQVNAVPAISFTFFDPGPPPVYRSVATEPIALTVGPGTSPLPDPEPREETASDTAGREDIFDVKEPATAGGALSPRTLSPVILTGGLLVPWVLALGLWRWGRSRKTERVIREAGRGHEAGARFRSRVDGSGANPAAALCEFLAAHLDCTASAVIGPGLDRRLTRRGVPAVEAQKTVELLRRLLAARYGGDPIDDGAQVGAMVETLDRTFRTPGGSP